MSSFRSQLLRWLIHLSSTLTNLYPRAFRGEYEREIRAVSKAILLEASERGLITLLLVFMREILAITQSVLVVSLSSSEDLKEAKMVSETVPGNPPKGIYGNRLSGDAGNPNLLWLSGWVLLSLFALPIAGLLMAPIAALLLVALNALTSLGLFTEYSGEISQGIGTFFSLAITTSVTQWLLLRPFLPGAQRWILATIAGWLAGGLVIAAEVNVSNSLGLPTMLTFALGAVSIGAVLGTAQMLYLRHVIPNAGWWLVINVLAFSSLLLVGPTATNLIELFAILVLPGLITGIGMRALIVRRPIPSGSAVVSTQRQGRILPRWSLLILTGLGLILLFFLGTWVYATSHLALAKNKGIYATPEEAVLALNSSGWGGAEVIRIENVHAGPNYHDGSSPHVWFGGADVYLDRIPEGGRRDHYSGGSYYLRVEEGWVHLPEGALPGYIGWVMTLYGLEGASD